MHEMDATHELPWRPVIPSFYLNRSGEHTGDGEQEHGAMTQDLLNDSRQVGLATLIELVRQGIEYGAVVG
jgi:hypothetical protein